MVRAGKKESGVMNPTTEKVTNNKLLETNGAKALFQHKFYPNAIVKFHSILEKYPDTNTCGEIVGSSLGLRSSLRYFSSSFIWSKTFKTPQEDKNTSFVYAFSFIF